MSGAPLNIQHLESLNDQVARITGVRVAETVPDTVLEMADEIELIDLPPAELRARLQEGHIYRPDVARRALEGFFREGNLAALREIALRRAAQRIDRDVASYMRLNAIPGPWPAGDRVLALVGPDESAQTWCGTRHGWRMRYARRWWRSTPSVATTTPGCRPRWTLPCSSAARSSRRMHGIWCKPCWITPLPTTSRTSSWAARRRAGVRESG